MSDWIDAGETDGCAQPDEKGCLIAIIFMVVLFIAACFLLPKIL